MEWSSIRAARRSLAGGSDSRWRCCPTKLPRHPVLARPPSQGHHRASSRPAEAPCKRSPSLLFREGEGLAGLSICVLQTISKGVNSQFPGNFSKEGLSALLFLIPSLEPTGQWLNLALFQPAIKKLNDLPPPGFAIMQEFVVRKAPPLHLHNCFISAPAFPQPLAQPSLTLLRACWWCSPQRCTVLLRAGPNGAVVNTSHKATEAELLTSTRRLRAEKSTLDKT